MNHNSTTFARLQSDTQIADAATLQAPPASDLSAWRDALGHIARSILKSDALGEPVLLRPEAGLLAALPSTHRVRVATDLQSLRAWLAGMQPAGLADWQMQVAGLAAGNSRLLFALCCAFAGPLLADAGHDGAVFHLHGATTTGKTSALRAAASVWGAPVGCWRATEAAAEVLAALADEVGFLLLDESDQVGSAELHSLAGLLAKGQGPARVNRSGDAMARPAWRLLVLSAGELPAGCDGGPFVDIPFDAGAGMGGIQCLNGMRSAAQLVDAFTNGAASHQGAAGLAWLAWTRENNATLARRLRALTGRDGSLFGPGQVGALFALVAAAGELATEAGITGWHEGHATWGVLQCFDAWRHQSR